MTHFDSICFLFGLVFHFQYGSKWTFGDVTQHLIDRDYIIEIIISNLHSIVACVGTVVYLKVFVPRHCFLWEFGQEHGDEHWQTPLRSQLLWADSCQPQDVLWDVGGLALEHSTLAQTPGRGCQATEACWDRQAHAGEEATPSRRVLALRPLQGRQGKWMHWEVVMEEAKLINYSSWLLKMSMISVKTCEVRPPRPQGPH